MALDAEVVADHGRDPFNNFGAPLSARFLQGFVDLYDQANGDDWYAALPAGLPVLVLAGDQDPVAHYGEGAYHVANKLVASGHPDVRTRVFTGGPARGPPRTHHPRRGGARDRHLRRARLRDPRRAVGCRALRARFRPGTYLSAWFARCAMWARAHFAHSCVARLARTPNSAAMLGPSWTGRPASRISCSGRLDLGGLRRHGALDAVEHLDGVGLLQRREQEQPQHELVAHRRRPPARGPINHARSAARPDSVTAWSRRPRGPSATTSTDRDDEPGELG